MLSDIIKDNRFMTHMEAHITELVEYLLSSDQHFGLVCRLENVEFNPPLPDHIKESLNQITLFFLAGYTFESTRMDAGFISFEAGFGSENFGSVVTLPVLAVMQLIVEDTPIFINVAQPRPKESDGSIDKSMAALMANPQNRKLLKKDK